MPEYTRAGHRVIAQVFEHLNADLLARAKCFFGGGTRLALTFDEYRESRDIDFLCAEPTGYALLRSEVLHDSLGKILRRKLVLAREVRADRDGIRTFFSIGDARIKFEILLEARLALDGAIDPRFGLPTLSMHHQIAEKLLANTDRGLDESTLARDLIDLAFIAAHVDAADLAQGLALAERPYGAAVGRALAATLDRFAADRRHARRCIESLAIVDTSTLRRGLRLLRRLVR